jgi:hypothetical protein
MAANSNIFKMSNAGGFKSLNRYYDMLAGNTVWNPFEPAGAYESIGAVTVPSGGVASITFGLIPQTYSHLQIRGLHRSSNTGSSNWHALIRFNSDSGNNYTYHGLRGDGSSAIAYNAASQSFGLSIISGDDANTALSWGGGVVDILDYSSTNKNKTIRTFTGFEENGQGMVELLSSLWMNTAAVSTVTLSISSGTFLQNSSFALYGIKG